ncbi:MAG: IS21 family transposase [Crocinitomicaceae bacterium]|nr:IS21 family transposase [Crocinitomicaceae bacterium]
MARKLDQMDLKQIISLHLEGISNRGISDMLSLGRNTVNNYMALFKASEVPLKKLISLDEPSLRELFPIKTTINNDRFNRLMEYFEKVNLARNYPGFTFKYHYNEYKEIDTKPYGYTQFMERYNRRYTKNKGSMKLEHLAGHEMMIDFAGKLLYITDKQTGQKIAVQVFVAILPCSQYTYVQACVSQSREDLIGCVTGALSFYGGVPKAIISDNLKSAVSRSCKYEPQINKSLKDMAQHYGCVINPTRTYSPQDKALVEHAVKLAYQRIYYPLRETTFFSLNELNAGINGLLGSFNDYLFQLKDASRKELFQSIERKELKPLPGTPYQIKDYRRAKVQKMGYVYFSPDKSYYSVPHRFIGKQTQIHYTSDHVEVYYDHERIALHSRNKSKGTYNTIKEHLCSSHQAYSQWSPEHFKKLAKPHGEAVMMFVEQIIGQVEYPETAYKRAMGVIQLHREYGSERLNNACQRALYGNALSYGRVKNILKHQLDRECQNLEDLNDTKAHIPKHRNIRGSEAYN